MDTLDPKAVKMHYLKNSDYKTVYATGFIGGPTANGLINIHVITDRNPIPQTITLDTTVNPPREIDRETKLGIIREVPLGLLLDRNTAVELQKWLVNQIATLDNLNAAASPKK